MSDEVLASTEYRGPPWDLSVLEGVDLVYEDGVPMDTIPHKLQMDLLIELVWQAMHARGRSDFLVSGDMFVYYTPEQARFVATHEPDEYRAFVGPDFVFIDKVPPRKRKVWIVWEEDGRYPDVIAELLSPSTAHIDRGTKKRRYAEIFQTPEYYLYEPGHDSFTAYHLHDGKYVEATPSDDGRVYSPKLDLWLGLWYGVVRGYSANWLRLFTDSGHLIPTGTERADIVEQRANAMEDFANTVQRRADAERKRADDEQRRADDEQKRADDEQRRADDEQKRADDEQKRADAAEAEIARLRGLLGQLDRT